uniref:F-box domain-containing protein n=1 Tax=Setaria digitata TaxID=48799 RepID=A0A915PRW7_9BILA
MILPPSMRRSRNERSIDDIPVEVLLMIFKRCEPLACFRARLVCRRWRIVIDKMDKESREAILGEGQARLYICDRRRAILEKFSSLPSCSNSVTELITARKSVFYADCYAHTALNNWTYRFDMSEWTRNFDIIEVWVQNFGAFLERDQGRIIIDNALAPPAICNQPENFNPENKIASNTASFLLLCRQATPSPTSRASSQSPHACRSGGSSSGLFSYAASMPYNLLPSSQKKSQIIPNVTSTALLNENVSTELTKLSDGRFERLAEQLRQIHPLHLIFHDLSWYQKRPTLLLFWFLKKLPNLRRLTLHSIRGDQMIELHKVFCVDGIDELNIIQPAYNSCIVVNEGLLDAFLQVSSPIRRRFRLRLTGKTDINASALCNFIRKWRNHREIIPFHTILIDETCVSSSEFIHATKCPGCSDCGGEVLRHKSNGATWNTKQLVFRHRKYNVWINYKSESGYLVFTYYNPKDSNHFTVKTVEPESTVVSFYSSTPVCLEKPEESDIADRTSSILKKPTAAADELTVLQRIFALIRSSA